MCPYVEVKEMKNHTFQIFHRGHKQGQGEFMRFKGPPIERQKWNTFTLKWDSSAEIQTQRHPKTLKHVRMTTHTTVYVCITPVCPSLSGHIWLQFDLSQGMYQLQCPRVSCWDFSGLADAFSFDHSPVPHTTIDKTTYIYSNAWLSLDSFNFISIN